MILIDIPRGKKDSPQYKNQYSLRTYIRAMGIESDFTPLQWGDAAFDGNGPDGIISIGVERKALHDMLNCIEDSSYAGHQRIGMSQMYNVSFLLIEGYWKPREDGILMESRDGQSWWPCRPNGRKVMYSKLRRYMISIAHSGVIVNYTQTLWHTAYDICEAFHYYSKKWDNHTSLRELRKIAIPQMNQKAGIVRKWAAAFDDIGVKLGERAERKFKRPIDLAKADETQWLEIDGMDVGLAQRIVRQINGW